jgi:PAS domain S-box-containing protein
MTEEKNITGKASELRKFAEQKADQFLKNTKSLSHEETQQVLHELRVHQIELEMQNEELRTSRLDLEASRARYLDLYDLAPVGYCTVSEEGLILEANLTAAVMLDVLRGAVVTQHFGRFIFKEDQDLYHLHRNQILKTKEPQSFDLRMLKKDGTVFWAQLEMIVIQDDYSRPSEYRVVLSDITERKWTATRLSLATQAGGVGLWDYAPVNKRLVWDEQMFRLYGTSSDKFSGAYEAWLEGVHPDDRQSGDAEIRLALSGEKEFNTEFRVLWPDRSVHNIRAQAIVQRDAAGHPLHVIGTNWDITAQKQMENTRIQLLHDLGERVKELNCMYGIAQLASTPDISLEVILQGIVELIPLAWQYPEVTCARITLNGRTFTTGNFIETRWSQTAAITLYGAQAGLLEICYLKEQAPSDEGPFLKEERLLINAAAERIGKVSERKRLEADIEKTISSYRKFVPHQMLNLLGKESITDVEVGDQVEKDLTILFSDIRDFTAMTEVFTPKESFNFINSYLGQMETIVSAHNGVIDKFIGDAIMAIFPESAEDALNCSLSMLQQLDKFNEERKAYGHAPVNIGIGLNTGLCMLGTVGGFNRMQGTVIGDAVNISSRLESETKKYGVHLLIGENTYYGISDIGRHNIRFIDRVLVKGKSRPQSVYEVFDNDPVEVKKLKNETKLLFEEALAHYHYKKIDAAKAMLEKCIMINPGDNPA